MNSYEETIPSYVLDWIQKKLNEFEKRLEKNDEFLSSYTTRAISAHEQPPWHVATAAAQPRPLPDPPNGQSELYHLLSLHEQPAAVPQQSHPLYTEPYGQPLYQPYTDPYTDAPPWLQDHVYPPPPPTGWPPPPQHHSLSCWSPTNHHREAVYCSEQPSDPHQHYTYWQHHHQYQQPVQSAAYYWQQHNQYQEPVLDQQPPQQRFPSFWHPPSPCLVTMPSNAISPSCSPDTRYGSVELFADDMEEPVNSREIYYDDTAINQLLNRDQIGEEEVLLNFEEVLNVANEKQLDTDFPDVIAQTNDAIHSSVVGNAEASKELTVKEVDSRFGRHETDKKWKYAGTIGNQSEVGENSATVETNFITNKTNICEDVRSDIVDPDGDDVTIISRRSTALNADARFIPPRNDTPCLGIHGYLDKLRVLALNHWKHDVDRRKSLFILAIVSGHKVNGHIRTLVELWILMDTPIEEQNTFTHVTHLLTSTIKAEDGSIWFFTNEKFDGSRPFTIQANYEGFADGIQVGDEIVFDGGMTTFEVVEKVLAKIESLEALHKLHEIVAASDGIVIARGDLDVQISLEQIPSVLEEITSVCRQLNKPVVVAFQLLESMVEYPTPTRAEFAAVSEAVRQYVDEVASPRSLSVDVIKQAEVEIERLKELVFKRQLELEKIYKAVHMELDIDKARQLLINFIPGTTDLSYLLSSMDGQIAIAKEVAESRTYILDNVVKVFDPGGTTSPNLLFVRLFVVS